MSYTNGTTHYNLPLTSGSDKRDWADTNQSFSNVDAALYGAVQDTAQAELDIDALETRMDTAEQNIATNTGDIAGLDTRVTTVEGAVTSLSGQVTDTRQDLEDMICAYNEASATSTHAYSVGDYFIYNDVLYKATASIGIGDTIVPDTNCSTTNVTTEIASIEDLSGDIAQLQTDVGQLQSDVSDLSSLQLIHTENIEGLTNAQVLTKIDNFITSNPDIDYRRIVFTFTASKMLYRYNGEGESGYGHRYGCFGISGNGIYIANCYTGNHREWAAEASLTGTEVTSSIVNGTTLEIYI